MRIYARKLGVYLVRYAKIVAQPRHELPYGIHLRRREGLSGKMRAINPYAMAICRSYVCRLIARFHILINMPVLIYLKMGGIALFF
jgi:hypothetical protein